MMTGIQAQLAGAALAMAIGTGLGVAYEHYAPWALGPRLSALQNSLPRRDAERFTAGAAGQRVLDQAVIDTSWRPALAQCQSARIQLSQSASTSITAERDAATRQSTAAYRLGLASCKGSSNASGSSSGSTAPVRVSGDTDLRDIVAAAVGSAR